MVGIWIANKEETTAFSIIFQVESTFSQTISQIEITIASPSQLLAAHQSGLRSASGTSVMPTALRAARQMARGADSATACHLTHGPTCPSSHPQEIFACQRPGVDSRPNVKSNTRPRGDGQKDPQTFHAALMSVDGDQGFKSSSKYPAGPLSSATPWYPSSLLGSSQ
jgi:hypothetical protein